VRDLELEALYHCSAIARYSRQLAIYGDTSHVYDSVVLQLAQLHKIGDLDVVGLDAVVLGHSRYLLVTSVLVSVQVTIRSLHDLTIVLSPIINSY